MLLWYSLLFQGLPTGAADYVLVLTALVWVPPLILMGGALRRLGRKKHQRWAQVLGAACVVASAGNLVLVGVLVNLYSRLGQYDYITANPPGCYHVQGIACDPLPPPLDLVQAWHSFKQVVGPGTWRLFAGYIIFLVGLMGLRGDWEIPEPASAGRP